ncbi:alanine racemase [Alteromonas sp. C1M14]|uniref:alanine racemase n=1 Tax=Alteromonas sp. C1M14 TaxID=2841567 RepID=UPI001C09A524|nr:alanine racemase [Alteromonas sp. C1M14]MBU2979809.1 alanine racemase [Alteromonas sp. C1M14]
MALFSSLVTPLCLIDKNKLTANVARMASVVEKSGLGFRPHVKTLKSIEAAASYAPMSCPITVSTLREARYFASAGYTDILYAVGITPNKLSAVTALLSEGIHLCVVIDSMDSAKWLKQHTDDLAQPLRVLIELDVDDHRAGMSCQGNELVEVARCLSTGKGLVFSGVMAHAGASYDCYTRAQQRAMAEQESMATTTAVETLLKAGFACDLVSVGSTPTVLAGIDYSPSRVNELRAGVYATFDLVMADLQVCQPEDIALSVLTSVIGHQKEKNWVLIDAGWMALSRDKGSDRHGYGLVADSRGHILEGWYVSETNQEHGIIKHKAGLPLPDDIFAFGQLLRILPNHACATAGQFSHYQVTEDNESVTEVWGSAQGW